MEVDKDLIDRTTKAIDKATETVSACLDGVDELTHTVNAVLFEATPPIDTPEYHNACGRREVALEVLEKLSNLVEEVNKAQQ